MLTVILLAHRIDLLMGTDIIKGGAIYFYLVNELISITENYAKIGLPLPNKLRQAIAILKKQEELSDKEWAKPRNTDNQEPKPEQEKQDKPVDSADEPKEDQSTK